MILADENIDHSLIKAIRDAGFEVYSIYESNRGLSDEAIIDFSRNPPRIILTEDKDFGEWVFAHNISDILIRLLDERSEGLFGHFTTITTQKIRSKPFL
jgi:predicted nuclease of predicted toxin-antitoxin system